MAFHFPGSAIHPPIAIGWVLAVIVALHLTAAIQIPGYLRDNYEETWRSLGSPGIFSGNIGSRLLVLGFIWSKRITALGDTRLTTLVWTVRFTTTVFTVIVAACYFSEYAGSAWKLY